MERISQPDLAGHVFDTGVLMNRIAGRQEPSPQTTESIAAERRLNYATFRVVLAAMLYEHHRQMHPWNPAAPGFFDAPDEVQRRFETRAAIAIGMSDPERESLARHAGSQRAESFRDALAAYLDVLASSDGPEVDPRRI